VASPVWRWRGIGKNPCIVREKPEKEIVALERELERARFEAQKNEAALSALEEQRRERQERLATALRAQQDLEQQLDEKRMEAERAAAAAAFDDFKEALVERDAAAEAFASAAQSVMLRLQEFDAAQESAETAWETLLNGGTVALPTAGEVSAGDPSVRPDPFREALSRLIELVRDRSDEELERDLVEAAARSPAGNAIPNLPTHLQELARARFFALAQERRRKQSSDV
jgi:hypothetical protein